MATEDDYELNPPKLVRQKDLDTCWACCMSSLLGANQSPKQASEDELVKTYATTSTGGIGIPGLVSLAKAYDYIFNSFQTSTEAASIFTDGFIVDRLKRSGMLMAAWRVTDPKKPNEVFFHAQIVWGVSYISTQDFHSDRALVKTMNPWTKRYELYPLFWIYRPDNLPLFTCWPNQASS